MSWDAAIRTSAPEPLRMPLVLLAALALGALLSAGPASAVCVGDCDGDGRVPINELIRGVNIALEALPASECTAFDRNEDGQVRVDELLAGVNAATGGCPIEDTPTATAPPTPTATPSSALRRRSDTNRVDHQAFSRAATAGRADRTGSGTRPAQPASGRRGR